MLGLVLSKGGLWAAMLGSAVLWAIAEWQRLQELREQEEAVKELKALRRRAIAAAKREERARQLEVAAWARRLLEDQQVKSTTHIPALTLEAPEPGASKPLITSTSLDCKDAPPCHNQVDAAATHPAASQEKSKFRRAPSRKLHRPPAEVPGTVQWRCELEDQDATATASLRQGDASSIPDDIVADDMVIVSPKVGTQSETSSHDQANAKLAAKPTSPTAASTTAGPTQPVLNSHSCQPPLPQPVIQGTSHADRGLVSSLKALLQSSSPQASAGVGSATEPVNQSAEDAAAAATTRAAAATTGAAAATTRAAAAARTATALTAATIGAGTAAAAVPRTAEAEAAAAVPRTAAAEAAAAVPRTAAAEAAVATTVHSAGTSEQPSAATAASPNDSHRAVQNSSSFSLNPFAKPWTPPVAVAVPEVTSSAAKPGEQRGEVKDLLEDGFSEDSLDRKQACWCESDDPGRCSPDKGEGTGGDAGTESERVDGNEGEGSKLTLATLGQLQQQQEKQKSGDTGEASLVMPSGDLVTADKIEQAVRLAEADLRLAYPHNPYTPPRDTLLTKAKQQLRLSNKACQVVAEKSSYKRRNLVGRKEDNKWITPPTLEQQALSRYRLMTKTEEHERKAAMTTTPVSQLPLIRSSKVLHEPDLTPMDAKFERAVIGDEKDLVNTIAYALENNKKVFHRRHIGDKTVYTWIAG